MQIGKVKHVCHAIIVKNVFHNFCAFNVRIIIYFKENVYKLVQKDTLDNKMFVLNVFTVVKPVVEINNVINAILNCFPLAPPNA